MTKTGQICLVTADNEKEQMPYRSMIKNHDKQALYTWRCLHASNKTHQGKIHMKTNMKKKSQRTCNSHDKNFHFSTYTQNQ